MTATAETTTLTKADIEHITDVWIDRLGLTHWDIKVRWEREVEKGFMAEIKISSDYEQASISIQQQTDPDSDPPTAPYTTWTRDDANRVLVHELLHIFEKQTRRAAQSLDPVLSNSAYEIFFAWYEHGAENWVDRLCHVLVDLAGCV